MGWEWIRVHWEGFERLRRACSRRLVEKDELSRRCLLIREWVSNKNVKIVQPEGDNTSVLLTVLKLHSPLRRVWFHFRNREVMHFRWNIKRSDNITLSKPIGSVTALWLSSCETLKSRENDYVLFPSQVHDTTASLSSFAWQVFLDRMNEMILHLFLAFLD